MGEADRGKTADEIEEMLRHVSRKGDYEQDLVRQLRDAREIEAQALEQVGDVPHDTLPPDVAEQP